MLTRRQFLAASALLTGTPRLLRAFSAEIGSTEISTPLGRLRGTTADGVQVFKGIPFAQPPVGPLRFRAPQPPAPWKGTRDATAFAPAACQPAHDEQSEDCLYLNVWAPTAPGPHPVFVWVHGGGFTGGRSSDPGQDGATFARAGIVVVTVAYRLGVLGFLDLEPVLGPTYAGSANNGLRDVVAALTWVQGNIAAFGGDPKQVTLGGESAGAKLADILLGVPSATPLFHQAVSESGGAERVAPKAAAHAVAEGFAKSWTEQTSTPATSIATSPAAQLIAVQEKFMASWPMHFPLRPELDGIFLPQPTLAAIRSGSAKGKRLLLGTNRDESALFLGPHPANDPTPHDLGNIPLAQFQPIATAYAKLYPTLPPEQLRIRSVTAEEYWLPSLRVVQAIHAGGGETFLYRFDYPGTGRFAGEAFHSYDLRFVWDHLAPSASDADHKLAQELHSAWCSFIAGKAPAAPGLPAWPAWEPKQQPTMILDKPSHLDNAPQAAELALWGDILSQ